SETYRRVMTVTRRRPCLLRCVPAFASGRCQSLVSNPPGIGDGGMMMDRPIGIAGAGSIGCFVGGVLAAAGASVALLARPRVIGEIESHGLKLASFEGFE